MIVYTIQIVQWQILKTTCLYRHFLDIGELVLSRDLKKSRTVRPIRPLRHTTKRGDRGTTPEPSSLPTGSQPEDTVADEIFRLINEERRNHNVPELVHDQRLEGIAVTWSNHMAQIGAVSHERYYERIRASGIIGTPVELNACVGGSNPEGVVNLLKNSPQHYEYMTLPRNGYMGVGVTGNYTNVAIVYT